MNIPDTESRLIVSIQPSQEFASELRYNRMPWFWIVVDEADLDRTMDVEGYSHCRRFGGDQGTAFKVYFHIESESALRKSLRRNHVKPWWGEVNQ